MAGVRAHGTDESVSALREGIARGHDLVMQVGDIELMCSPDQARVVLGALELAGRDGFDPVALPDDLTTGEAAGLLNVSRPTVVALVDSGELPAHRVGTHRRVRSVDVLAYRARRRNERSDALDELARISQSNGLYESRS